MPKSPKTKEKYLMRVVWQNMVRRCYDPNSVSYGRYGAKGVTVCERWRESYENFIADMGTRPTPLHTLDRKDNSLGYCRENCRWITNKEQQNNKPNNRVFTINGDSKTMAEWAEFKGISYKTLSNRVYLGWEFEDALNSPVLYSGYRLRIPTEEVAPHRLERIYESCARWRCLGCGRLFGRIPQKTSNCAAPTLTREKE